MLPLLCTEHGEDLPYDPEGTAFLFSELLRLIEHAQLFGLFPGQSQFDGHMLQTLRALGDRAPLKPSKHHRFVYVAHLRDGSHRQIPSILDLV